MEKKQNNDADKLKEITKICSIYSQSNVGDALARTAINMIIDVITEDYI